MATQWRLYQICTHALAPHIVIVCTQEKALQSAQDVQQTGVEAVKAAIQGAQRIRGAGGSHTQTFWCILC